MFHLTESEWDPAKIALNSKASSTGTGRPRSDELSLSRINDDEIALVALLVSFKTISVSADIWETVFINNKRKMKRIFFIKLKLELLALIIV